MTTSAWSTPCVNPNEPSYLTLADQLVDDILALEPGDRVPSEHDLAALHGVSRVTTRSALQELERRHLVRRIQGSGTFVASRIPYPLREGADPSWTATVEAAGHTPSYGDVEVSAMRASAAVARALLIPRGRSVTRLTRTGFVDGDAAAHQLIWFPTDLVPGLDDVIAEEPSLGRALPAAYGLQPERWWSRAEMTTVPGEIAHPLGLTGRPPAWRIESANRCARAGRPIQSISAWLRADAFQVFLDLGPTDGPLPRTEYR